MIKKRNQKITKFISKKYQRRVDFKKNELYDKYYISLK
jgi:hypothetical protein